MKPEITDISYSTALTFELVTQYGFLTLGAHKIPSLRKESIYLPDMNAKSVLLFFVYKLSEHIVSTASSLHDERLGYRGWSMIGPGDMMNNWDTLRLPLLSVVSE